MEKHTIRSLQARTLERLKKHLAWQSLFILTSLTIYLTSCISPQSVIYFQGDASGSNLSRIVQDYTPVLQPNDLLSIAVGSLSAEANEIFNAVNQSTTTKLNYGGTGAGSSQVPIGYLVDTDGNIQLPLVGKVKVGGLTTNVAADTLRRRLEYYLKEPTVVVRNINFKVSVLGEVNRPSVYTIPDERITLPEVLSLAGDMTIFGRRDNVMVIREENGSREYAYLDLTSRTVFDSPFYYLHKNDVIYVEPIKARMNSTDRTMQILPLVISSVSVLTLVLWRLWLN